jgi:hypothetical protein
MDYYIKLLLKSLLGILLKWPEYKLLVLLLKLSKLELVKAVELVKVLVFAVDKVILLDPSMQLFLYWYCYFYYGYYDY